MTTGTRIVLEACGKPPKLKLESFSKPAPEAGEVLLRIQAAPINPADLNILEGNYGLMPDLPATVGNEGAAVVEACGPGVDTVEEGDLVLPMTRGTWASWMIVPAGRVIRLPSNLDPLQAAMLSVNPPTAHRMLTDFRTLKPGDWVVQNAANSGVGRCLIQIARSRGIKTLNLVRREELIPELERIGADRVLVDDGNKRKALEQMRKELQPALAVNAVGGQSALDLANALRDRGTHVTYGAMSRQPVKIPSGMLIFRNLTFTGFWLTRWLDEAPRQQIETTLGDLAAVAESGNLTQPVATTFPVDQFKKALDAAGESGRSGKILITFA